MTRISLAPFVGLVYLLFATACSHMPTTADSSKPSVDAIARRHPASNQRLAVLPDQANWKTFYNYGDALDLTNPAITLTLSTGGTSIYGVLNVDGKPIGAIIPENSSASVSGETFAFTLSRALGVSELYQPGVYHFLSGPNLQKFMTIVPATPVMKNGVVQANKELNRKTILKRYDDQPRGMDAVFKRWDEKPKNYEAINGENRTINSAHIMTGSSQPVASMILCEGPQPSSRTNVTFNGGTNTELEVARELSSILLIDALTQQWDRFSGGNLQTIKRGETSMFVSIDNGGTWGGQKATELNLSMVTRFDKKVADQILAMDAFFTDGTPYLGLRTEAEFVSAFDIIQAPKAFASFKTSLRSVAAHIRAHSNCYFN